MILKKILAFNDTQSHESDEESPNGGGNPLISQQSTSGLRQSVESGGANYDKPYAQEIVQSEFDKEMASNLQHEEYSSESELRSQQSLLKIQELAQNAQASLRVDGADAPRQQEAAGLRADSLSDHINDILRISFACFSEFLNDSTEACKKLTDTIIKQCCVKETEQYSELVTDYHRFLITIDAVSAQSGKMSRNLEMKSLTKLIELEGYFIGHEEFPSDTYHTLALEHLRYNAAWSKSRLFLINIPEGSPEDVLRQQLEHAREAQSDLISVINNLSQEGNFPKELDNFVQWTLGKAYYAISNFYFVMRNLVKDHIPIEQRVAISHQDFSNKLGRGFVKIEFDDNLSIAENFSQFSEECLRHTEVYYEKAMETLNKINTERNQVLAIRNNKSIRTFESNFRYFFNDAHGDYKKTLQIAYSDLIDRLNEKKPDIDIARAYYTLSISLRRLFTTFSKNITDVNRTNAIKIVKKLVFLAIQKLPPQGINESDESRFIVGELDDTLRRMEVQASARSLRLDITDLNNEDHKIIKSFFPETS